MSGEMKKFMELVSKDTELQNKIKDCSKLIIEEQKNKMIELAKEKGILLKKEDFDKDKISDEELKNIAGGCFGWGEGDSCYCPIVGVAGGAICLGIG